MSELPLNSEKRLLAFKRLKDDFLRVFVPRRLLFDAVESSAQFTQWINTIAQDVEKGKWTPSPATFVATPKKGFRYRPGKILVPGDVYAYNYAVLLLADKIRTANKWSEKGVRFSYRVAERGGKWFKWTFSGWKHFDRVSIAKSKSRSFIVVADIAGYYENIDIGRLVKEIRATISGDTVLEGVCRSLSSSLNKWSLPRGRGIPQGMAPSHVLGEFFLNPVDQALQNDGFEHVRYLDDVRIFCGSHREAVLALKKLAQTLEIRGLNLQSAKSKILTAEEARREWSAVKGAVHAACTEIAAEIQEIGEEGYIEDRLANYLREPDINKPEPEVVARAWAGFIENRFLDTFSKTLYHYLLKRLISVESDAAVCFATQQLEKRPEETVFSLDYLSSVCKWRELSNVEVESVCRMLEPDISLYAYQRYHVYRWLAENKISNANALKFARSIIESGNGHLCEREAAMEYVARVSGLVYDFNTIENSLANTQGSIERAMHVLALRHSPKSLVSEMLSRVEAEDDIMKAAVGFAKKNVEKSP